MIYFWRDFYKCGCKEWKLQVISSSSATGSILFGISRFVKRKLNFNLIFLWWDQTSNGTQIFRWKNDDFLLATNFNAYFFRFWGKKIAIPHNSPSKRSGQKTIQLLAPHYTHYDWCGQTKVEVVKNGHHTNLGFVHLPKILNTSRRRRIISTVIFIFWKNYCVSWTLLDNDGRRTSRFIYSAFTLSLP